MKESNDLASRSGQNGRSWTVVVVVIAGVVLGIQGGQSFGEKPDEPLARPFYSFDKESPTVDDGHVEARDILALAAVPPPDVAVAGENLGLDNAADEIDALSSANTGSYAEDHFMLLFSVTRDTVGLAQNDADPRLLAVPFHAFNQGTLGHGPGDQFMRIRPPGGSAADREKADVTRDNCLLVNQYDEGGSDFGGLPETTAWEPNPALRRGGRVDALNRDDVNSMMMTNRNAGEIAEVYFSLSDGSPYLGTDSGADIFCNPNPTGGGSTDFYAEAEDLLLDVDDDIDGMIVFDKNDDGVFNNADEVMYSLTPASPTLWGGDGAPGQYDVDDDGQNGVDDPGETGWEGSDDSSPADVFLVSSNSGSPSVDVYASAAALGLLPTDDVDALDYFICDKQNDIACANKYGIRWSPIPAVSEWGLVVMALLGLVAGTIMFRARPRGVPQQ